MVSGIHSVSNPASSITPARRRAYTEGTASRTAVQMPMRPRSMAAMGLHRKPRQLSPCAVSPFAIILTFQVSFTTLNEEEPLVSTVPTRRRLLAALAAIPLAVGLAACGDD